MSEELKPCPFCGGEAEIYEDHGRESSLVYDVTCGDCDLQTMKEYATKQEAVKYWNTRAAPDHADGVEATPAQADIVGELVEALESIPCEILGLRMMALRNKALAKAKALEGGA